MNYRLSRHLVDRMAHLHPYGEVDMSTADDVRNAIDAELHDAYLLGVIVDLADVSFLDCAGVGALVAGRVTAVRKAKRFDVVNASGTVRRVLEATGTLDRLRYRPGRTRRPQATRPSAVARASRPAIC
jgi:anti-anti-sigma factor